MNNILSIEIIISSISDYKNYYIDVNKLLLNNSIKIDSKIIDNIIKTICLWKSEYGIKGIDSEEFFVRVVTDKGTDTFHGKGIYPDNYQYFKEIVGEFNGY